MPGTLSWLCIVVGAALILLELLLGATTGFDFLLIGSAILLGGVLGVAFGSPALALVTAGILSLLYVLVGRRAIRGHLRRPGIRSNVDAVLGRNVQVVAAIRGHAAGRVKVEGEEWRALLDDPSAGPLEPGDSARIVRIDGVTVYVSPLQAANRAGGGAP